MQQFLITPTAQFQDSGFPGIYARKYGRKEETETLLHRCSLSFLVSSPVNLLLYILQSPQMVFHVFCSGLFVVICRKARVACIYSILTRTKICQSNCSSYSFIIVNNANNSCLLCAKRLKLCMHDLHVEKQQTFVKNSIILSL